MEPLTPNDPLWNVLGQAKPVKPRPNFVQNVVREARQTSQEHGWLAGLKARWLERESGGSSLAWAAAVVLLAAGVTALWQSGGEGPSVSQQAPVLVTHDQVLSEEELFLSSFELELKKLHAESELVAVQDTSELTATEIRMLLY